MPFSDYQQNQIGNAFFTPNTPVIAGENTEFELIYTAGYFGIDDSGSLKIVWRFASDMAKPQFDNPAAPNYVSIIASNGATLDYRFDGKNNIRPWGKTLYIKIVKGYFQEGDQLRIRFGDRQKNSPGIRMQTFCEDTFELKVLVDAFATCDYVELPQSPTLKIISGIPFRWQAVVPTQRPRNAKFNLNLKAEDIWGNPTAPAISSIQLTSNIPVKNLPERIEWPAKKPVLLIENLQASQTGDLKIQIRDKLHNLLAITNPLRISEETKLHPFWADMHGQSEETIGSNSIDDYFTFARDRAFLDASCHQGNDFQITNDFWNKLNQTTAAFNQPGKFVTFPGYEYSANTGLGGDHNVLFRHEGEQIHRSSHALIADKSDENTDRHSARELFATLKQHDAFIYAHVGGRYADLQHAADEPVDLAVEIHSAWGTFEWLLHDAFDRDLRVGIVANSDGHKGRPGASYPGASLFGSYGGLTCFLCPELTRSSILNALKQRHHYATTGARLLLDTRIENQGRTAIMGDCLSVTDDSVTLKLDLLTKSPIERVDIFNGKECIDSWQPECENTSRSIKLLWQGAEYRGRGRETIWDGELTISDNEILAATPINFWNPERPLIQANTQKIHWQSITTGGLAGCEIRLKSAQNGYLTLKTPLINAKIPMNELTGTAQTFFAGGLGRQLKIFRIPEKNPTVSLKLEREIQLNHKIENPIYIRVRLADGHLAWSSPIYLTTTDS